MSRCLGKSKKGQRCGTWLKYYDASYCDQHVHQMYNTPPPPQPRAASSAPPPEPEQEEEDEIVRLKDQVRELQFEVDELKLENRLCDTTTLERHATIERLKLTVDRLVSGLAEANERAESAERRIKELEEKVKTNE
jgi:hypothetical protein